MYLQKDHLENGYNEYLNLNESIGRAGMMDVALLVLDAGESYAFDEADKEIALLLFEGSAELTYDGKSAHIERHSVFDENPTCLLAPARTKISLKADAHTEIYVQKSINPNHFDAKLLCLRTRRRSAPVTAASFRAACAGTSAPFLTTTTPPIRPWSSVRS